MGPTHTVVDILDGGRAALAPMTVTALSPHVVVHVELLEVWEADPEQRVTVDDGVILLGWRLSPRPIRPGAAVSVISPLEALARLY